MNEPLPELEWEGGGSVVRTPFVSARGGVPKRAVAADDRLTADAAFQLVSQGTALVWCSDYRNARQLLEALGRRIDKRSRAVSDPAEPAATFNAYRLAQARHR